MTASPVAQFIEARGDAAEMASRLGKKPEAVRQWKFRGVIPRSAWPDIIEHYPDVTLDDLKVIEGVA